MSLMEKGPVRLDVLHITNLPLNGEKCPQHSSTEVSQKQFNVNVKLGSIKAIR